MFVTHTLNQRKGGRERKGTEGKWECQERKFISFLFHFLCPCASSFCLFYLLLLRIFYISRGIRNCLYLTRQADYNLLITCVFPPNSQDQWLLFPSTHQSVQTICFLPCVEAYPCLHTQGQHVNSDISQLLSRDGGDPTASSLLPRRLLCKLFLLFYTISVDKGRLDGGFSVP